MRTLVFCPCSQATCPFSKKLKFDINFSKNLPLTFSIFQYNIEIHCEKR